MTRQLTALCVIMIAVIAAVDLATANVNLSILYVLPVLIAAQAGRRSLTRLFVVLAILLTYAGYFLGPWPKFPGDTHPTYSNMLANYRMVNRTLSVIAVWAIAAVSYFRLRFRISIDRRRGELDATDPDGKIYEDILGAFEQLTAAAIAIVLVTVIVIADLLTPAQFNLPILYGVPLVLCALTHKRALIWTIVPFILLFTYAGYLIGPASAEGGIWGTGPTTMRVAGATIHDTAVVLGRSTLHGLPSLLTNRTISACAILACALLLHWWIGIAARFTHTNHLATLPPAAGAVPAGQVR